jgi:hypothetical protein
LKQVQDVESQGRQLAGAAMHLLALGNTAGAMRLLRRACVVHATQEVRLLSMTVTKAGPRSEEPSETVPPGASPEARQIDAVYDAGLTSDQGGSF